MDGSINKIEQDYPAFFTINSSSKNEKLSENCKQDISYKLLVKKLQQLVEDGHQSNDASLFYSYLNIPKQSNANNVSVAISVENHWTRLWFLRRIEISLSKENGYIEVSLIRGRKAQKERFWRFNKRKKFKIAISKLSNEIIEEISCWFKWEIFSMKKFRNVALPTV